MISKRSRPHTVYSAVNQAATSLMRRVRRSLHIEDERTHVSGLLYTPLQEVLGELQRRRENRKLRQQVSDFFGDFRPPAAFESGPRSVMVRYIASPTLELSFFADIQKNLRLKPLLLEFTADKFVARNFEKYNLCKLTFVKNGGGFTNKVTAVRRVVDFNTYEGKPLRAIKTVWGDSLVDFHHKLLQSSDMSKGFEVSDFSEWFRRSCVLSGEYYYLYYLALFLTHGILFENFLLDKRELPFTQKRVLPAFQRLTDIFGVRPLIVPIATQADEGAPHWCYYDDRIQKMLPPV